MKHLIELRTLIARHVNNHRVPALMNGLSLNADFKPTKPLPSIYEPVFAVVAQGAKRAVLADRIFDYQAGHYIVVTVDLPVICHITQASERTPLLGLGLTLKPQLIASVLLDAPSVDQGSGEQLGMAVSKASDDLLEAAVRLVRLLERPSDIPIMRPLIEREVIWRLLSSDQGGIVRQIGLADSRLSRINRAMRWIREHFAEPFRIEDLARRVAMSPTSFHRHFRLATAMSPLQYQKQIRLQEARSRLITKRDDIASVGFHVGYESPSQFSREYVRMFGEPPGRDASRMRAMALRND